MHTYLYYRSPGQTIFVGNNDTKVRAGKSDKETMSGTLTVEAADELITAKLQEGTRAAFGELTETLSATTVDSADKKQPCNTIQANGALVYVAEACERQRLKIAVASNEICYLSEEYYTAHFPTSALVHRLRLRCGTELIDRLTSPSVTREEIIEAGRKGKLTPDQRALLWYWHDERNGKTLVKPASNENPKRYFVGTVDVRLHPHTYTLTQWEELVNFCIRKKLGNQARIKATKDGLFYENEPEEDMKKEIVRCCRNAVKTGLNLT